MTDTPDPAATLGDLRRPRLLIRAARVSLAEYRRDPALRRLIGAAPPPPAALGRLIDLEARHEAARMAGTAPYSVARHIEALVALMAEVRLMPGVLP